MQGKDLWLHGFIIMLSLHYSIHQKRIKNSVPLPTVDFTVRVP